ncbi:MAG: hypothetical protein ACIAS6_07390 [Phycisphaerales bacterium JB060]
MEPESTEPAVPDAQDPVPGTDRTAIAPLSPAFLWHKLVQSWKRDPWATIVTLIAIAGAVAAAVARLGPWLMPTLGGVGLIIIVFGLVYFTWDILRLKQLVMMPPGDAWTTALLRKETFAAGCVMIAVLVTMPLSWNSPGLHVAQAQVEQFERELDAHLDRDEPDVRTNEQKVADSIETLARNKAALDLARGVGTGQYVVRVGIAAWSLLIAIVQHGIVMNIVLLWVARLAEARRDYRQGDPDATGDAPPGTPGSRSEG